MWRKIQKFLGTIVPSFLIGLLVTVGICMLNRWDAMVPITLIPIWAWAGFAMIVSLLCWIVCRNVYSIVVMCIWLAVGVVFSEETHGITRELGHAIFTGPPTKDEQAITLCVVNVNCNGQKSSLDRIKDLSPDVVIIQQAPEQEALEAFADELWGAERDLLTHRTNAILGHGKFLNTLAEEESSTIHVRLRHPKGATIDVTDIELSYCAPRIDMWKPEVWNDLIDARITNRKLVRAFLGENEMTTPRIGRIVSGGFGTPPADDVYRPLITAKLVDSYAESGVSWGNTYPGKYPLLRLDQIWVSKNLKPRKTFAVHNPDSDHRTVVTYLRLPSAK